MVDAANIEKEKLFQELDNELHDSSETSAAWQHRALRAELLIEKYEDIIYSLRQQIEELAYKG